MNEKPRLEEDGTNTGDTGGQHEDGRKVGGRVDGSYGSVGRDTRGDGRSCEGKRKGGQSGARARKPGRGDSPTFPPTDVIVLAMPAAPDVAVVKAPAAPLVTVSNTPVAPEATVVAVKGNGWASARGTQSRRPEATYRRQ